MLFFELFPDVITMVAFVAGIWLWVSDRQARRDVPKAERQAENSASSA